MSGITLKKAKKQRELLDISDLAHRIWREFFPPIISTDQIEYMLEKFQSPPALEKALAEGYDYYFISRLGVRIGYVGVKENEPLGKMFLSKLYLLKEYRGRGYASCVFEKLTEMCQKRGLKSIWLTVNKRNPAFEVYRKKGFNIIEEKEAAIGGGFVMDDYIMEKTL